jgi:hypothetical protein
MENDLTKEESMVLENIIKRLGVNNWSLIAFDDSESQFVYGKLDNNDSLIRLLMIMHNMLVKISGGMNAYGNLNHEGHC